MRDYKELVVGRLSFLDDLIAVTQKSLKCAPPGRLLLRSMRGKPHYYHLNKEASEYDKYLKADDKPLIRALAQKEYYMKLLESAQRERKAILACMSFLGIAPEGEGSRSSTLAASSASSTSSAQAPGSFVNRGVRPEDVYLMLPEDRKALVTPPSMILPDDLYARKWLTYQYTGLPLKDHENAFLTDNGEMVRSKSELIIANTLHSMGVPYRYECPLYLGGSNTVYPDFTVLNVRLRKVFYWEHLGLLSDPLYLEKSVRKINSYERAGYYPGDRLLITRETAKCPLSTESIKGVIRQYLL